MRAVDCAKPSRAPREGLGFVRVLGSEFRVGASDPCDGQGPLLYRR